MEIFAIVHESHWGECVNIKSVADVFVSEMEAKDYIDRMEIVMRKEYNWKFKRPTYEEVVRTDDEVCGKYNKFNCSYKIVKTNAEIEL